jgi:hypothetical protein
MRKKMTSTIEREAMLSHLKNYRSYLYREKKHAEGDTSSGYAMLEGAIKAVNNLLREVRRGEV